MLCRLKDSEVLTRCLQALPPACTILVMDNLGRILVQRQGTSQQGSTNVLLKSSLSSSSKYPAFGLPATTRQLQKSLTASSSSTSSTTRQESDLGVCIAKETMQVPESIKRKIFEKLAVLEAEGSSRRFTSQELCHLTHNFSSKMLIGQGGNSKVYRTNLVDGQVAAVKVLKCTNWSEEEVLREVELLSSIKHENIVRIIGYCHSKEMHAIVYNLLKGSLKHYLKRLKWNERMDVAIGVAKALEYLHHTCDPPIIHRDVKSSNILLSENFHHPQVSFSTTCIQIIAYFDGWANGRQFHSHGTGMYLDFYILALRFWSSNGTSPVSSSFRKCKASKCCGDFRILSSRVHDVWKG